MSAAAATTTSGGNFKCPHGIDTNDVNEWNNHCSDPKNNHTESGTTQCIQCGELMAFENLPFHKIDAAGSKNINERCDECEESRKETRKNSSIRKIKKPVQQQQQQQQQPGGKPPQ